MSKANLKEIIIDIKELSESFPCGYLEVNEIDEDDESPDDMILHLISVIRKKCIEALK